MKQQQNTTTAAQGGELNFYAGEVARRQHNVTQLATDLASAKAMAAAAATEVEISEGRLVKGEITDVDFAGMRQSLVDFEGTAVILTTELRMARRLLDKAQNAFETVRVSYEAATRSNVSRQVCEILAPVLDSLVEAFTRVAALEGVAGLVDTWLRLTDSNTRFGTLHVSFLIRQLLNGGSDAQFLGDWIDNLRKVAPDLITVAMENFLSQWTKQVNERFAAVRVQQQHAAHVRAEMVKALNSS